MSEIIASYLAFPWSLSPVQIVLVWFPGHSGWAFLTHFWFVVIHGY